MNPEADVEGRVRAVPRRLAVTGRSGVASPRQSPTRHARPAGHHPRAPPDSQSRPKPIAQIFGQMPLKAADDLGTRC